MSRKGSLETVEPWRTHDRTCKRKRPIMKKKYDKTLNLVVNLLGEANSLLTRLRWTVLSDIGIFKLVVVIKWHRNLVRRIILSTYQSCFSALDVTIRWLKAYSITRSRAQTITIHQLVHNLPVLFPAFPPLHSHSDRERARWTFFISSSYISDFRILRKLVFTSAFVLIQIINNQQRQQQQRESRWEWLLRYYLGAVPQMRRKALLDLVGKSVPRKPLGRLF